MHPPPLARGSKEGGQKASDVELDNNEAEGKEEEEGGGGEGRWSRVGGGGGGGGGIGERKVAEDREEDFGWSDCQTFSKVRARLNLDVCILLLSEVVDT